MPKVIDIPGTGTVEFPDSMPDQDISRVIRLHTPEPETKGSPEWVSWRNQRVADLNEHANSPAAPEDKSALRMLWDKVNPFAVLTQPGVGGGDQPGQGPIGKVISGVVRAGVTQAQKAKEAYGRGDYLEAAGHAGAAALPVAGPMAANFGEHAGQAVGSYLGGNPDPNATKEAITDVAAAALPVVAGKGANLTMGAVGPGAEQSLRASAETDYNRTLAPTTKGNKIRTENVVPGLIDRGVVAPTLKGLQNKAQANIATVGQAIGDAWDSLPPDAAAPLKPVFDRLQSEINNTHSIADSNGKVIPKGPEGAKAIGNIENLQQVLVDVAQKDPQTGELVIPANKARDLRQYFDNVQKAAGSFEGKNLNDASTAAAHEVAANSIREELGKQFPDIASLNKEYSFWKDVDRVVTDTLTRKTGQSKPLGVQLARGAGFIKGGPVGAEAMSALTSAVRSPAWRTVSAVTKDRLADAIATGNRSAIEFYVGQIGRAVVGQNLSSRESQTPQLAGAPAQ